MKLQPVRTDTAVVFVTCAWVAGIAFASAINGCSKREVPYVSTPGFTNSQISFVVVHEGMTEAESSNLYALAQLLRSNPPPQMKWCYIGNPPVKLSYYGHAPSKETVAALENFLVELNESGLATNMHTHSWGRFTLTWTNSKVEP